MELKLEIPAATVSAVFGQFDSNIRLIDDELGVSCSQRDGRVTISGGEADAEKAARIITQLSRIAEKGGNVGEAEVRYALSGESKDGGKDVAALTGDIAAYTAGGRPIHPKTLRQKTYVDAITSNMITFGIGPAGTGKTYLAMAMAVKAFRSGQVTRIILTRPAIEAGEKLGFLPGDLQSKVDPYLRPLYDALYEILGADAFARNQERGLIEVAPLAYMRGRTLDNAFIILDEAQNTTPAQMKMFLTRIGFGSKVVVTGDQTQKDLPAGAVSGLDVALKVVQAIDEIAVVRLTSADVVRHPLVQKIVKAYELYEKHEGNKKTVRRKIAARPAGFKKKEEG